MNWLTNEVLFYGGVGITVGSVLLGIIHLVISKFKALSLKTQLISEYGEMVK